MVQKESGPLRIILYRKKKGECFTPTRVRVKKKKTHSVGGPVYRPASCPGERKREEGENPQSRRRRGGTPGDLRAQRKKKKRGKIFFSARA